MGATAPSGGRCALYGLVPSTSLHPKLRPPLAGAATKSSSSILFCPTSPIHRSLVSRSNDMRHGLRKPYIHTSGAPSLPSANGLSGGIEYGFPPLGFDGSMRRMLPRRSLGL